MIQITTTTRIAISLAFVSLSILLIAHLIGLAPNRDSAIVKGRVALCEAIAIQCSYFASKGDNRGIKETLNAMVDRGNGIRSLAVRGADGRLIVEVGNHATHWVLPDDGPSTDNQIRVPIIAGQIRWGVVEVRFDPLSAKVQAASSSTWDHSLSYLQEWFLNTQTRLFLFVTAAIALVNLIYLRRVLRQLDPTKVVPDRVRNALDTLAEGLLLLDANERIVMANESFSQIVGKSDDMLIGRLASELAWDHDEFGARVESFPWTEAAHLGAPTSGTLFLKSTDKEIGERDQRVTFKVNAVPILSDGNQHRGSLVCFDDVTLLHQKMNELSQLRQELVDTAREAGMAEIATDVLHNVGNVLNSVNVSVAMLSQNVRGSRTRYLNDLAGMISDNQDDLANYFTNDEKGRLIPGFLCKLANQTRQEQENNLDEIDTLTDCVEHIKEIVRMQQDYAKLSAVLEQCDPNGMMDDALRFADVRPEKFGIEIERQYDRGLPEISVTKGKILQTLVNLVKNAKEAILEQASATKKITLRTFQHDANFVRFEVTDTGMGIDEENLTKIFAHGFTTKSSGHGFGLHGSALAVKEMGGEIHVTSPGPGKGATFTIDLPIASPLVHAEVSQ